ncbi:MAG: hypothetical protein ABSA57_05985 [Candidatus Acidiferrales bacterium]|jgi:hypothetical protein
MNILVIFHSEDADGEKLALTLALGAVQAKCDIRLRYLGSKAPNDSIHKGYVAPRNQDLEWADALVLAIAPRSFRLRSEVEEFLVRLQQPSGDPR